MSLNALLQVPNGPIEEYVDRGIEWSFENLAKCVIFEW